jgi:hypothetical protein
MNTNASPVKTQTPPPNNPCQPQVDLFIKCIKAPYTKKDKHKCKSEFDTYSKCINMLE